MPLSEHMYCVSIAFKMTEYSNESASNFALREAWTLFCRNCLDDSKGHSCGQLVTGSFITMHLLHHVLCWDFGETANHPGESAPFQPRFGTLWLLAYPQTKITFDREEISECQSVRFREIQWGSWWQLGELYEVSRCLLEGDWGLTVLCTMFLVPCIFFSKCLYFSYYTAGCLLDRPHMPLRKKKMILAKCLTLRGAYFSEMLKCEKYRSEYFRRAVVKSKTIFFFTYLKMYWT